MAMSEIKKMVIYIVLAVVIIITAMIILLWFAEGGFFFLAPSYGKMDRFLKSNIDELSYVTDALSELDYDSIDIRKIPLREEDKSNMVVTTKKYYQDGSYAIESATIPIPDELIGHIEALYENGVLVITCERNSVDFSLWSIIDESRGIIYSRTGEQPNGIELIDVRQLSTEDWYYYVHNYEKAKARNPQLFQ